MHFGVDDGSGLLDRRIRFHSRWLCGSVHELGQCRLGTAAHRTLGKVVLFRVLLEERVLAWQMMRHVTLCARYLDGWIARVRLPHRVRGQLKALRLDQLPRVGSWGPQ